MIKRRDIFPARYLPALDAALDKLRGQIERDEIPAWGQDASAGELVLELHIERPTPLAKPVGPASRLVREGSLPRGSRA